jgi:hypothetical protein
MAAHLTPKGCVTIGDELGFESMHPVTTALDAFVARYVEQFLLKIALG